MFENKWPNAPRDVYFFLNKKTNSRMSKLKLPSDVAKKIAGMLNPKDVPRAILVYQGCRFYIRGDACTEAELKALTFPAEEIDTPNLMKIKGLLTPLGIDPMVARALALGFEFSSPEDRLNSTKNEMFTMHRRRERVCEPCAPGGCRA